MEQAFGLHIGGNHAFYYPTIKQLGPTLVNIIVSPLVFIIEPLVQISFRFPASKIWSPAGRFFRIRPMKNICSTLTIILPLKFKTYHYDYLEIYGKHAIGYLFEVILGEVIKLVQAAHSSKSSPARHIVLKDRQKPQSDETSA